MDDVFAYIDQHASEYVGMLQTLIHQSSVAAQGVGMAEMAALVIDKLGTIGIDAREYDTRGGYPVVYGELAGASPKRLSFYNHYDVQPAEPLDLWHSDPWAAEVRDGRIWGRGVADNKGNIAARIAAIDAYRRVRGELPVSVKFIIEGEEEIGSPHLEHFADDHPDLCQADGCIWEFGGKGWDGRPQIYLGLKGICYVELRARGANADQHSSIATTVPNPAWRLVWALASLKNQDEHVLIPGFYDKVQPPTNADIEALKRLPDNEQQRLEHLGLDHFLMNLTGIELKIQDYFQPTCTISGLLSGYTGAGSKTVLPSEAMAKVDMRLVPDQDPFEVFAALRKYLDDQGFDDIDMELLGPEHPARTPLDSPLAQVVAAADKELYGVDPVIYPTSAGSGPWYQLCTRFGVDACTAGVGHPRTKAHAPNENIYVDDFVQGIKQICLIMERFGAA
ncbi:MAG TPA: M20/M25/M40 family metallo-hydrolase [Thermomicrobiales bacterium]|nr:M20/M25/M40 family metallo-hydrolase [Thermomicrobiales bacterium]